MDIFRPYAKFENLSLVVVFRTPASTVLTVPIKVVVDLDEYGTPSGIEILGFEDQVGPGTANSIINLIEGSDVRFSYDPDTDSAAIGVALGDGTRTGRSVSKTGKASLDSDKKLVTIEVNDLA